MKWSLHSMLQSTTGQLVFDCYMLLEINFQPKCKEIWLRKKKNINDNNKGENEKQVDHEYEVGQYAYCMNDLDSLLFSTYTTPPPL